MEYPPSNGVVIDNEELKKALVDKIYDEQSKTNRANFRAALAGEIMASISGAAYTQAFINGNGWKSFTDWEMVAKLEEK